MKNYFILDLRLGGGWMCLCVLKKMLMFDKLIHCQTHLI